MTDDHLVQARQSIVRGLRELTPRDGFPRDEFDQIVRALELLDVVLGNGPSITCPYCGWTSYHPEDIRFRYCGHCHDTHELLAYKRTLNVESPKRSQRRRAARKARKAE